MSNFTFLKQEFPSLITCTQAVEKQIISDPRSACFLARHALERIVHWLYENERSLRTPYDTKLDTLLHSTTFKALVPQMTINKMFAIKKVGNQSAHSRKQIHQNDALCACKELFHVCYWLARTYMRQSNPTALPIAFKTDLLPKPISMEKVKEAFSSIEELKEKEEVFRRELKEKEEALKTREKTMAVQTRTLEDREAKLAQVDYELAKVRGELAKAKERNEATADTHDYSEAETRTFIIDLLLKEAGWEKGKDWTDEFEVTGMPNKKNTGYVDYVLWGNDGLPLAVVEAKRTTKDPHIGQHQAELYANCLEKMKGRRPIIFYTNGYETWLWDDMEYPARQVQGFYNKAELELLIQRRSLRKPLKEQKINKAIADRFYQERSIKSIGEHFEQKQRKSLLTMATGTGKTRTAIALVDVLMRCNWAKRVLFLADRVALVKQAVNAFKEHLPESSPVNLVTEKDGQGRVYGSTYPTMMGLIQNMKEGCRQYGVGYFDLIIIDEAHRSVYQKYGAIFEYFDSLLVGLTATPREEIHHDTYHLFDLETGVPTDTYGLEEAVKDGSLVPPRSISVPLKFQQEGITYEDLSEEDKEQWENLDWGDQGEEGGVPEEVSANEVNTWLFNEGTVDKVLRHLMENGQKIEGGDKLAKTIIFAKNQKHAEYIEKRFNCHYPKLKGTFARVITHSVTYAQSLIDKFSETHAFPQIAISVDMLDTGIDVPEVANLVFFKVIRSKTKFLQMVGRGTRLCPDLFAPNEDKTFFTIFDFCGNLEFFKENPEGVKGGHSEALGMRLFKHRLDLLEALESKAFHESDSEDKIASETISYSKDGITLEDVTADTRDLLHAEVLAMNLDNFIVRPKRKYIDPFLDRKNWDTLNQEALIDLNTQVAGLPSEQEPEDIHSKLFDLTCLKLQLGVITADKQFAKLREQVMTIASNLEEKETIPHVKAQMVLIQRVQMDEYWEDITLPMLENLRRKLRDLVQFVDKRKREPVYTVLQDEIGEGEEIELDNFQAGINLVQYRKKVEQYIKDNEDHVTIHKLKFNKPLTESDLKELEHFLFKGGEAKSQEQLDEAFGQQECLSIFIRSLVGLDQEAGKKAFAKFLDGGQYNSKQIRFVEMIIDHLTKKGVMDAGLLYEQPFTGIHFEGLDGVFPGASADEIVNVLESIRNNAVA